MYSYILNLELFNVTLVVPQMFGYMFWFLRLHDETLMMIWKNLLERHELCFVFLTQDVHTTIVSHSQFNKHLLMPRFSRWHPLCGRNTPNKNICLLQPGVLRNHHVIGSFSQATQMRASLSNSKVHVEDIGRTVHIYFLSGNKMSRPNEQQKH
jgi:hypothetical protein